MVLKLVGHTLLVSSIVSEATLVVVSSAIASPEADALLRLKSNSTEITLVSTYQESANHSATVASSDTRRRTQVLKVRNDSLPKKQETKLSDDYTDGVDKSFDNRIDRSSTSSFGQTVRQVFSTEKPPVRDIAPVTSDINALAEIDPESNEAEPDDSTSQVTNLSQLQDVKPGDWAYESLRELVERYGCIAGYPNGTYRGNRAMTRYEFAAGLRACLNQIEKLIASRSANFVSKQDLTTIRRLSDEFGTEVAKLRGRVDGLEARTTELEANQFSTTTRLNGEVVVAVAGFAKGDNANRERIPRVTELGDRVRLDLASSFTGKDQLRIRLQALNLNAFSSNTTLMPEGDLRFAGETFEGENNNTVGVDEVAYFFPLGKSTTVVVGANANEPDNFTNTINPFLDGEGGSGALSNFGTRNPIYNLLFGAGIGLRHQFSKNIELSLGYLATTSSVGVANPQRGAGLFNGPYGALAQLTLKPTNRLLIGLTYVHSYNNDLTAGSQRANLRSYLASPSLTNSDLPSSPGGSGGAQPSLGLAAFGGSDLLPVSSNSYGIEASFKASSKFFINGWVGYTANRLLKSRSVDDLPGVGDVKLNRGDLSILNFAINFAFPDLGKQGNLAGIIIGMEPKVTGVSHSLRETVGKDRDTSLHLEGFYQYQVNDSIAITPGLIYLTAPNHDSRNSGDLIGIVRTTFNF